MFNYKKIYLNQEKELVPDNLNQVETITYDELNYIIQPNVMDRGTVFSPIDKFPLFYRTHAVYQKPYNLFDFKIFIHRNPLDTLISSYYFSRYCHLLRAHLANFSFLLFISTGSQE